MAELTPELQDALHDLNQFLSDNVAPLIVTDAVSLLMEQPPELMAAEIQNWTLLQYQGSDVQIVVDALRNPVSAKSGQIHRPLEVRSQTFL